MKGATPIFVAGKSGKLARSLCDIAAQRDIHIVAAGRPDFDIEHSKSIDRALNVVAPQVIINAAAYTAVDKAETEPERCYFVNCDGAARLAAAAWRRRVPFIHVSTDYVFDGRKTSPYREDDETAPLGVYGWSKLAGEQAVFAAHPQASILRTSGSTVVWIKLSRRCCNWPKAGIYCETLTISADAHIAHDLAAALLNLVPQL